MLYVKIISDIILTYFSHNNNIILSCFNQKFLFSKVRFYAIINPKRGVYMKRLNNELLKKEFKKVNNNLIIAIVCLVLGLLCIGVGTYAENRTPKDTKYLNDIIESTETNREDIKSNIKVSMKPILFAKMNNDSNKKYYITADDKFYYIISLTENQYKDLVADLKKDEQVTIYGKTKLITSEMEKLATNFYNQAMKSDEDKITDNDKFYNIFGDIYLDSTNEDLSSTILYVIGALCLLMWTCFLLVFIIYKVRLEKTFKKIDDEELQKIEKEIDDKDSFHYERAHLILTKSYVISFLTGFRAIKYQDIIWVYEYRLRQYGVTTQKSIMVMDKTGKVKPIITLDGITKKSKIVFNEIIETIINKNPNIIVGYNKENKKRIKEEYNFKI